MNLTPSDPAQIIQLQLDAYNRQDIEAFSHCFAEDVEVFQFPNVLSYSGIQPLKEYYEKAWLENPNQHAELKNRTVISSVVLDEEYVTGRTNGINSHIVAIYTIENHKIKSVHFVR